MTDWIEEDSQLYTSIAEVAVPRRHEMMAAVVAAVPFAGAETFRIVEIGAGEGRLAEALLDAFPGATLVALDGSESMRRAATARTGRFGERVKVRDFALGGLDWWDVMSGADVIVSSLCLHHLSDAKKQHLYKAIAGRISARGALIVADLIDPAGAQSRRVAADAWDRTAQEQANALGQPDLFSRFVEARWNHFRYPDEADRPAALLHHLVWLKHAGFSAVDCLWLFAGHAVFGGFQNR
jgi:tRNA (cmo5U34)-methyltransferase